MASSRIRELVSAEEGRAVVLQGNIAFAVGCARGGIHAADGYPGTPSTEVIDKGLRHVQDHMRVGWSVNEAAAVALGFGTTMAGDDAVVTLKIPGLFQAADVVATAAGYTAPRGGLVLYIASDFTPSSTQYVTDPRYFLKSCFIPVLEPRSHQEMLSIGPTAAAIARQANTPVAVLASGLLCHSEGLVRLNGKKEVPRLNGDLSWKRFMNLPRIARQNYETIHAVRVPAVRGIADESGLNRIEWNDRDLGVVVHGIADLNLREIWDDLPVKPSVLSLGMTNPVPSELLDRFVEGVSGRIVALGDGLRFVQEELLVRGIAVEGKPEGDPRTEWSPAAIARALGAEVPEETVPAVINPVMRPPNICAGCPYRAFGLVVQKLRKRKKILASFGDIGCNTLLFFLDAIDTCTCMGASDSERQGVVLADPSMADKVISVLGDSTECHSGLDATRNAVFRNVPGVKVVLDNRITAMTGGQPAPSSESNLAGEENAFDLVKALKGEGAKVMVRDAFDMKAIERALKTALTNAAKGDFTVLVLQGECMHQVPAGEKQARFAIDTERCKQCGLCLVCPGIHTDEEGFPEYTQLCVSCGGNTGICVQTCKRDCFVPAGEAEPVEPPPLPDLPDAPAVGEIEDLPASIRLAVRGVGGQGNLFLGKILADVALAAGYENVIKGETHGMAQLGGPVISTFGCGDAFSPVPAPGSIDVLVVLERSEVLRPGFLDLLKPDGVVLLNRLSIVPERIPKEDYPSADEIREYLGGRTVIEIDALAEAQAIGDQAGWSSNAVALGALSRIEPFSKLPLGLWTAALIELSPTEIVGRGNVASFLRGREAVG
jgi:indolepyruvate ferredoxin oxidoreductase alpha subunit